MVCNLYWIRRLNHTDPFTEGYIGVSVNPTKRWGAHRRNDEGSIVGNAIQKYDDIVYQILVKGVEEDILGLERKMRPRERIGWNLAPGGSKPPVNTGHSEDTRAKMSKAAMGNKNGAGTVRSQIIGTDPHGVDHGPMTTPEIAKLSGCHVTGVARVCSGKYKQMKGWTFRRV